MEYFAIIKNDVYEQQLRWKDSYEIVCLFFFIGFQEYFSYKVNI